MYRSLLLLLFISSYALADVHVHVWSHNYLKNTYLMHDDNTDIRMFTKITSTVKENGATELTAYAICFYSIANNPESIHNHSACVIINESKPHIL
jgi:hypothetical protein